MQSISVMGMPTGMPGPPPPPPQPSRQPPPAAETEAPPAAASGTPASAPAAAGGPDPGPRRAAPPGQEGLLQALLSSVMGGNAPGVEVATSQETTPEGTVEHTTISIEASAVNDALQGILGTDVAPLLYFVNEAWMVMPPPQTSRRRRRTVTAAADQHAVCACALPPKFRGATARSSTAATHGRCPAFWKPLSLYVCTADPTRGRRPATDLSRCQGSKLDDKTQHSSALPRRPPVSWHGACTLSGGCMCDTPPAPNRSPFSWPMGWRWTWTSAV